jgi:hypothetical protein
MIVVSIGAAVMVVIQGLTEEQLTNVDTQSDLIACGSEVDIDLVEIDNVYRICRNVTSQTNGTFVILMENSGLKQVTGFKFIVYGDDGFNSTTYTGENLDKGELQGFRFNFGGVGDANTELSRIEINPQITGKETVTCKEPNLQFNEDFIDALTDCRDITWDDAATGITVMTT